MTRSVAYVGAGLGLALGVLALVTAGLAGFASDSLAGPDNAISITFPLVGGFLVSRRPRHPVAWAMLVAGVGSAVTSLSQAYAYLGTHGHDIPGVRLAAWAHNWTWVPGFVAFMLVLFPYFPGGALPSRRWRHLPSFTVVVTVVLLVAATLRKGAMNPQGSGTNPFGVIPSSIADVLVVCGAFGSLAVVVCAAVSLVVRARRASGAERQQLRLIGYAALLAVIGFLVNSFGVVGEVAMFACFSTPAVAIAVAVLRYRLFDIDRVISRTLAYALVTGCVVGIYLGMIGLTTRALPLSSGVGVAAATLAAAAAFQPLRRRIQDVVDRRFNRARYDAEHAVETFAARLRDEVDLPAVNAMLLAEAARHLEPASASLWLA